MTVSQPGYNAEKKLVLLSWLKVWLESILRGISPQINRLAVGDPYSFQIQRRADQKKCRIWILVRMLSVQMACFWHVKKKRRRMSACRILPAKQSSKTEIFLFKSVLPMDQMIISPTTSFSFQKYKKPKFIQCFVFSLTGDVLTGDSEGNILTWGKSAADVKTLGKGAKG